MRLRQNMQAAMVQQDVHEVARRMGYSANRVNTAVARIEAVLSDPHLGLDGSWYDGTYSSEAFVRK
ncbi:hypothetical protein D6779_05755, partial [Candidatus Parcubacteria bacterium]